ncbi:MAG: hypothetical protein HOM96_05475 [Rickettsiales bacterium]|nr:hypothetical protein [Rickettsiales bacterium]
MLSGEVIRRGRVITTTLEIVKSAMATNNIEYVRMSGSEEVEINQKEAFVYIKKKRIVKIDC